MPFMQTNRALRKAAAADININDDLLKIGVEVKVDQKDEAQGWSKVATLDNVLSGWVKSDAVGDKKPFDDPDSDPTKIVPEHFFRQCWREGLFAQVPPHYLAAVAKMRSNISGAPSNGRIGPYNFTGKEWDDIRAHKDLKVDDLASGDIAQWYYQCAAFAAITARDLDALTAALKQPPTAHELYLTALVGLKAAIPTIMPPDESVDKNIALAVGTDVPAGGMSATDIMLVYAKYFTDPGTPSVPVMSTVALDRIGKDLQAALDAVKDDIVKAGTDVLGAAAEAINTVNAHDDVGGSGPSAGGGTAGPQGTAGNDAGGKLGELIAKKEAGKAGYNAYNRRFAGDAGGKAHVPPFATMSIADIQKAQSLPKSDAARLLAVGKYQIIPSTMRAAVKALKLDTSKKYDEKMQEFLFRHFLVGIKRPAVRKYVSNPSPSNSDLTLALKAMAFEFASVGEPPSDQSHYGGVGHNRALISFKDVAAVLQAENAQYQKSINSGASAEKAWNDLSPGLLGLVP